MSSSTLAYTLRPPANSRLPSSKPPSMKPPALEWLQGTWNVTHSTLPMWKKNRNVQITYTRIPNTTPVQVDDTVSYQPLNSDKKKTIHGVDKPFQVLDEDLTAEGAASLGYNWRGKGWLMIAGAKWEILGYGDEQGTDNRWVVTFFAKTLFTPAGIDVYARKGQLLPETIEGLKTALAGLGGDAAALAQDIFAVASDGAETTST